jgi:hypothetical protein
MLEKCAQFIALESLEDGANHIRAEKQTSIQLGGDRQNDIIKTKCSQNVFKTKWSPSTF